MSTFEVERSSWYHRSEWKWETKRIPWNHLRNFRYVYLLERSVPNAWLQHYHVKDYDWTWSEFFRPSYQRVLEDILAWPSCRTFCSWCSRPPRASRREETCIDFRTDRNLDSNTPYIFASCTWDDDTNVFEDLSLHVRTDILIRRNNLQKSQTDGRVLRAFVRVVRIFFGFGEKERENDFMCEWRENKLMYLSCKDLILHVEVVVLHSFSWHVLLGFRSWVRLPSRCCYVFAFCFYK